jgi:uncharacterized protein
MDAKLLDILACPKCKDPLAHQAKQNTLTCKRDGLVFPIRDNLPILLEQEAKTTQKRKSDVI